MEMRATARSSSELEDEEHLLPLSYTAHDHTPVSATFPSEAELSGPLSSGLSTVNIQPPTPTHSLNRQPRTESEASSTVGGDEDHDVEPGEMEEEERRGKGKSWSGTRWTMWGESGEKRRSVEVM